MGQSDSQPCAWLAPFCTAWLRSYGRRWPPHLEWLPDGRSCDECDDARWSLSREHDVNAHVGRLRGYQANGFVRAAPPLAADLLAGLRRLKLAQVRRIAPTSCRPPGWKGGFEYGTGRF